MTAGRSRHDAGVTDAMMEDFGDLIFELSHNVQRRFGDPVRELDFEAYEENREGAGLSDIEIAARLGLTHQEVTIIRNLAERRRIRTDTYFRLNPLGGGRRYRAELEGERRPANTDLRNAITLEPERVRASVQAGHWGSDTLLGWLEGHAKARPDHPAIVADAGPQYRPRPA